VAFLNSLRKLFYNIATTGLSIAVASVIGMVDLLQVFRTMLALHGGFFDFIGDLAFGVLGYAIVGIFLRAWGPSFALWRFDHIEARYFQSITHPLARKHSRVRHTHEHVH
jgi:high-affinity nickel-transport protein